MLTSWSTSLALAIASVLLAGPARSASPNKAEDAATTAPAAMSVLELFTSQGCSSCPTADALLETYAGRPDVVALTFPVDYWDYLGWKDTLASPKFSARQRAYAKARGDGRVYTPQVVVNGLKHALGSNAADIDKAITVTAPKVDPLRAGVRVRSGNEHIIISLDAAREPARVAEATIWLALIRRRVEVKIKRGENHGKIGVYHNVVREWLPVGVWNGTATTIKIAHHAIKQSGADGCAVILQHGDAGAIVGAALLRQW
ncbi:MAG: DUF1223 domain-containing protein [Hyphomicrobiaceae bacterium]